MKLPEIMQRQRVEKWKAQILFFGTSAIYFFKSSTQIRFRILIQYKFYKKKKKLKEK